MKLTPEQQRQYHESVRIFSDFTYWVDEYVWIEDKVTKAAIPFKLWPGQKKIVPKLFTCPRLISVKARQLGITWLIAAYSLWRALTKPLEEIVIISAKEEWAKEVSERLWFMYQRLPDWQRLPVLQKNESRLKLEHKDQAGNDTSSVIKSLTTTVTGAQSKTPTLLVLDETARNPHIRTIFANSKPGIDAAQGQIIVISNPHQDGVGWGWTRDTYVSSMRHENDFERIFMPWWDRPDRPKDFRDRQIYEGMDEGDAKQQYPETEEEAISSVYGSYFAKVIDRHLKARLGVDAAPLPGEARQEPVADTQVSHFGTLTRPGDQWQLSTVEPNPQGILEIWEEPYYKAADWDGDEIADMYAIGSDISEGLGETYSVAHVINRRDDNICARLRSNRVDAHKWAGMLYMLAWYYQSDGKPALICAERTGAGITTIKRLSDLNARQYQYTSSDKATGNLTVQYGWKENQQSKYELCGDLYTWLQDTPNTVPCGILIDECSTYIRHENGKLDPESGKYGDAVIAMGCTLQASQFIGPAPKKTGTNKERERQAAEARRALSPLERTAARIHEDMVREAAEGGGGAPESSGWYYIYI